jgi:hypothetical protein
MASVAECVRTVLGPYVGATAADTCVRATALSIGKTTDDLTRADLPALGESIRRLMGPVAPANVIDRLISDIEGRAS